LANRFLPLARERRRLLIEIIDHPIHNFDLIAGWTLTKTCVSAVSGGKMAKVLYALYDDPVSGYPNSYARTAFPK